MLHLATDRPAVRHNETLDFAGLRDRARQAYEDGARAGLTQTALAEALGRTQPAVSQALNNHGAKYAALQREIVSHLTGFEVVESFRVVRKAA